MRELYRSIARQRLKDMGVQHVNKHFGYGIPHSYERKLQKNPAKYEEAQKARQKKPPIWRRVLWGDLAKMYRNQRRPRRVRKGA